MPLPPYNPNIYWKNYEIDTPTFDLLPVEKPDMSPFLVHMTGRNQILSILRGENVPEDIELEVPVANGYLRSSIPEYGNETGYNANVVCFTESPTFALDFFRYRSITRWRNDMRYGIGFSKSTMVNLNVRPVIYIDNATLAALIRLKEQVGNLQGLLDNLRGDSRQLVNSLYPLCYPLLENSAKQGFMWEREWRYPRNEGFVFPFNSIKIICCPENEEQEIRNILGDPANNISFIRSWVEYDDVTNFILRQQRLWNGEIPQINENDNLDNHRIALQRTKDMLTNCRNSLHSLEAYEEFIDTLENERNRIDEQKENLNARITELTEATNNIQRIIRELER